MPALRPFFVLLVDGFGCTYEWAEYWASSVKAVQHDAPLILNIDPIYVRIVAL